ncbi:hypothetical protein V1291_003064 [Nitrobacteraceae bacterium AZCC 1564]
MDLDAEFMTLKESGNLNISGRELIEDKALPVARWFGLRRQLVEPFAAARYFGEPLKIAESDHISIAKPCSAGALQYRLLKHFLMDFPATLNRSSSFPSMAPDPEGKLPSSMNVTSQQRGHHNTNVQNVGRGNIVKF